MGRSSWRGGGGGGGGGGVWGGGGGGGGGGVWGGGGGGAPAPPAPRRAPAGPRGETTLGRVKGRFTCWDGVWGGPGGGGGGPPPRGLAYWIRPKSLASCLYCWTCCFT
ncbi:hypothetical protein ABMY87_25580 [Pseudomonas aeruginosa]|uniref:hypothetical protein n=1 Tax=Pseudomonas aeruginosa TaxID=287 RepID=UPI0039E092D5